MKSTNGLKSPVPLCKAGVQKPPASGFPFNPEIKSIFGEFKQISIIPFFPGFKVLSSWKSKTPF